MNGKTAMLIAAGTLALLLVVWLVRHLQRYHREPSVYMDEIRVLEDDTIWLRVAIYNPRSLPILVSKVKGDDFGITKFAVEGGIFQNELVLPLPVTVFPKSKAQLEVFGARTLGFNGKRSEIWITWHKRDVARTGYDVGMHFCPTISE